MHSSSKTTWPDRTSAAERGSVIDGSGRTGPSRPATATSGHIPVHMLSPQRSGRSPFRPPQLRACLDGPGRSPVSFTFAGARPDQLHPRPGGGYDHNVITGLHAIVFAPDAYKVRAVVG